VSVYLHRLHPLTVGFLVSLSAAYAEKALLIGDYCGYLQLSATPCDYCRLSKVVVF
jgi:hypothetical protein